MLAYQHAFYLFVFDGRAHAHDILLEPGEVENRSRAVEGSRQTNGNMASTEDAIVDFLEDRA